MTRPLIAIALALLAMPAASWSAGVSVPPPPAPQPMAAPLETTDWIVARQVNSFEDGKLRYCAEIDKSPAGLFSRCAAQGAMTPEEALAKIGPAGARLTGFSPYLNGYGSMTGMILYYRRADANH